MSNELEEAMTATTLTHLAAREHINDLRRQAEQSRRAPRLQRSPRRIAIGRVFARRVIPRIAGVR